jgi:hypothetical protein
MKSSTLKLITEIRSLFLLCEQLESRIPSLKKLRHTLLSFTEFLSTIPPTLAESVFLPCVKEKEGIYSEIEQKIVYALIREKIFLSVSYLRASRDKNLDLVFLLKIQEMIQEQL